LAVVVVSNKEQPSSETGDYPESVDRIRTQQLPSPYQFMANYSSAVLHLTGYLNRIESRESNLQVNDAKHVTQFQRRAAKSSLVFKSG